MLNLGVSARLSDAKGNTSLHLATKYNRIQNVNLIIQYESSQSIIPSLFNTYNRKGYTPFHIACQKGFIEIVKIFIDNRVQIDFATSIHSGELTSLMIASKYGYLEIVKLLVEQGATINIFDKKNRCALTYAVRKVLDFHSIYNANSFSLYIGDQWTLKYCHIFPRDRCKSITQRFVWQQSIPLCIGLWMAFLFRIVIENKY